MCILLGDRRLVQSARKCRECIAHHAKPALEDFRICSRKLTNGADAVTAELALCGIAHIQKVTHRQRVDNLFISIRLDDRYGIGLFIIAAEFRGDLIERHPNGYCNAKFSLDAVADFLGNFYRVPKQTQTARNIQPCFVKPKGFNLICIIIKNFSHIAAVLLVFSIAGGYNN